MNINNLAFRAVLGALFCLVPADFTHAHDSWLVASRHSVNENDEIWLSFVTGDVFPFGDAATDPKRVARFVDQRGNAVTHVTGLTPEDNALSVRGALDGGGLHIIGCELKPRLIELEAAAFDEYIEEEQAKKAIARRKTASNRNQRVVEQYTKSAKTIVEVLPANPGDTSYEKPLGHRLEIIPLSNPIAWHSNSTVRVKVLLDGHPWPDVPISVGHEGATVVASNRSNEHTYAARSRTDDEGIVAVNLTRPGHWFIKAHLIRPSSGLAIHEWESFWATLTFRVQGSLNISGDIQAMKTIHGELTPWVVAGYRMGKRALRELSLPGGSRALLVVHKTPLELPYSSMADGIQAATAVTVGKLSLRLESVPSDDRAALRSEFTNKTSGQTISFQLREDLLKSMLEAAPEAAEAVAMKMMTLEDDDIFVITSTKNSDNPDLPG
ncbi:MAG: DUF4198 domain-containing protein [Phycisphaerales bacterium]|nr:DUF4198 domain-containing protein [Phycisphaerales bacterium]